jgi:hypothetical protein
MVHDWVKERREQLEFEARLLGQLREGSSGPSLTVNVLDEATAERMARTFLARRQAPEPLALPAEAVKSEPVEPADLDADDQDDA